MHGGGSGSVGPDTAAPEQGGGDRPQEPHEQFDAFYASTVRWMVAAVYPLTGSLADAEDAVHEAYARAWSRWSTIGDGADPAGWVRVVAQRLAVSAWRKARNRRRAHERSEAAATVPGIEPDHVALVAALQRLPVPQRRVIVLFHLLDLPVETVAREMGCSEGAVRVRLTRARQALARALGNVDAPPEAAPTTGLEA
ncbi:RNA polymerase sigma factor [Yinghuangia seranimata]|uniref:RNA polymerase sigma factor n=1 Tax=Yinghuangia seranimata TaxID=408067 RepID=UPI00248D11DB|nr:SigE family RNA polymerase sigma factor [Yinghuangia seranimata]MDI2125737.1 SigE family RNA polymerase sigma factor [Yinghuangia seranimata]